MSSSKTLNPVPHPTKSEFQGLMEILAAPYLYPSLSVTVELDFIENIILFQREVNGSSARS